MSRFIASSKDSIVVIKDGKERLEPDKVMPTPERANVPLQGNKEK